MYYAYLKRYNPVVFISAAAAAPIIPEFTDQQKREVFSQLLNRLDYLFGFAQDEKWRTLINLYLVIVGARSGFLCENCITPELKQFIDQIARHYGLQQATWKGVKDFPIISNKMIPAAIYGMSRQDVHRLHDTLGEVLGYPCTFSMPPYQAERILITFIARLQDMAINITNFTCKIADYNPDVIEKMRKAFEDDLKVINPQWQVLSRVIKA